VSTDLECAGVCSVARGGGSDAGGTGHGGGWGRGVCSGETGSGCLAVALLPSRSRFRLSNNVIAEREGNPSLQAAATKGPISNSLFEGNVALMGHSKALSRDGEGVWGGAAGRVVESQHVSGTIGSGGGVGGGGVGGRGGGRGWLRWGAGWSIAGGAWSVAGAVARPGWR